MIFKTSRRHEQHITALDLLPHPGGGGEDRGDGDLGGGPGPDCGHHLRPGERQGRGERLTPG